VTIRQRRKKLEEMARGNGLGDAYTGTLARLKAQKGNKSILGLKVLMWVLYSERPLRAEELRHALGVEIGSVDLDLENVPTLRTILASSLGLVTVEASSSTVRLVHFTLQEHLLSDPTLFHSPHSAIAEICLTYLNFRCVRALSPTLLSAPATTPLLDYASCYWGKHAERGMTDNVKTLALRLLDGFDKHISAQLMLLDYKSGRFSRGLSLKGGPRGFTGLHGAAFVGIVEILTAVLEIEEWDVNASDIIRDRLFALAFRVFGRLTRDISNQMYRSPKVAITIDGRTPLMWAAERGHEGAVRMLLGRGGVNPDQAVSDWTPLLLAAECGREGVVKSLLGRADVNPNQAGDGWTPLLLAAEFGHEGVVKILLDRECVDPNRADNGFGLTPLSLAAQDGSEGIVKMLLERADINPDRADTASGCTPLLWAASRGHEGVARMLLERKGVNPDRADTKYGRTPLSWAARHGYEPIVKMLLERKDVRTDMQDNKNQTPLSLALSGGHHSLVRLLSERGNPNSNIADLGSQVSRPLPANSITLSTQPSSLPQPPLMSPSDFWYPLSKTAASPSTPRSTLPIAANLHLITASFVCVLAFLIYILPLSSLGIFSFRK